MAPKIGQSCVGGNEERAKSVAEDRLFCSTLWPAAALAPQRLQDVLSQADRIALAALGKFDHFLRYRAGLRVIALADTERAAHVRVGPRHDGDGFRLERLVLEKAVHGHAKHPRISLQSRHCGIAL
jgi:hypothetical protein